MGRRDNGRLDHPGRWQGAPNEQQQRCCMQRVGRVRRQVLLAAAAAPQLMKNEEQHQEIDLLEDDPVPGTWAHTGCRPAQWHCVAITRQGFPCSRMAQPGSYHCWQHAPYTATSSGEYGEEDEQFDLSKSASTQRARAHAMRHCAALSSKGFACTHMARPGSKVCCRHAGMPSMVTVRCGCEEDSKKVDLSGCAVSIWACETPRCEAVSSTGVACTHVVQPGCKYCWKHGGTSTAVTAMGGSEKESGEGGLPEGVAAQGAAAGRRNETITSRFMRVLKKTLSR